MELPESNPQRRGFTPEVLDDSVIAIPLLNRIKPWLEEWKKSLGQKPPNYTPPVLPIMIDLNSKYERGREEAVDVVTHLIEEAKKLNGINLSEQAIDPVIPAGSQYVVAQLEPQVISKLVQLDRIRADNQRNRRAIFRIWPDFEVSKLTYKSLSTIKADAARVSFSALGENIVWAVVDSGIDAKHPHFYKYQNLRLDEPLKHCDYTSSGDALLDEFGHGTHVAGIIAGGLFSADLTAKGSAEVAGEVPARTQIQAVEKRRDEEGEVKYEPLSLSAITGMAPKCRLVSLKVLDGKGQGRVSRVIAALEEIQRVNSYGRKLRIHGVNLSVGYEFEPEWFACGQSPLCVEVNLLVRSGVVVVVAAGNTGYGYNKDDIKGWASAGLDLTINDPGNAELAITVGSTHRSNPHTYGISYFSSKGPTGDGRLKPDLVAPGEKILSCAAGKAKSDAVSKFEAPSPDPDYIEDSGTSMAAPHVSGAIAAFLSVRNEFIGRTDEVKSIFLNSATDLKRDRNFQGHGVVDLMRAIQSV